MIISEYNHICLSPVALRIIDTLLDDGQTTGQKASALQNIKNLPLSERTLLWENLQTLLPPQDYQIAHNAYIQGTLNHRWSL